MAVRLDLEFAIIAGFGSQRACAEAIRINEIKLSNIIRCITLPRSTEPEALTAALGKDYFAHDELLEARSR